MQFNQIIGDFKSLYREAARTWTFLSAFLIGGTISRTIEVTIALGVWIKVEVPVTKNYFFYLLIWNKCFMNEQQ